MDNYAHVIETVHLVNIADECSGILLVLLVVNAGVLVACVGKATSAIVTTANTLEDGFTVIGHGSLIGELQTVLVKREMKGAFTVD